MRKICVFIGSRANYSSVKSVMQEIQQHEQLDLQLVVGASALLSRFGNVQELMIQDGFKANHTFHNIVEGENPTTMAKSTGLAIIEMATVLDNLKPDFLVVVGDRFEMMAVTIAASYMNIRVAHTMGGEVTGTIDESIRHAITKFSHLHFASNEDAKKRIIRLGENETFVYNVGCPRIDIVAEELKKDSLEVLHRDDTFFKAYQGVGGVFNLKDPFLLVSQHPVTTEFSDSRAQIEQTLAALNKIKMNTILLWPNVDAGSDEISKGIRTFREDNNALWLHAFVNLPINMYIHLMNTACCLIGNSSSGIREGVFIGTPVVNIGTRQSMRMRGDNVIDVNYNSEDIFNSINKQLDYGRYNKSELYGSGNAGKRIADILSYADPNVQKRITY